MKVEQNYQHERFDMVNKQIISRGIKDFLVINTMKKIPRHEYVSANQADQAYSDNPLPIDGYQTISQPYIVALMTELLALKLSDTVLEIGTGSGYQTAVLAELSAQVYTIERLQVLYTKAKQQHAKNYHNIVHIHDDGSKGYITASPFNKIIVTAAAEKILEAWKEQLAIGGILVAPVGDFIQKLYQVKKLQHTKTQEIYYEEQYITDVRFVPLITD